VLGLLLAATVALYAGSRSRTPAPFGPAVNGLVAYADDGDIWTVDPQTEVRTAVVIGESSDSAPRFSRDGTRVAFFRNDGIGVRLATTMADGTGMVVSRSPPFIDADIDSIVWSPNGRFVAVVAEGDDERTTYLVDTTTGAVRDLGTRGVDVEPYWRPPDGRRLLYSVHLGRDNQLFMLDVEDPAAEPVALTLPEPNLRPGGWTPDGERFVVHHFTAVGAWTALVDPDTGQEEPFGIAYGRVSNDGTRIAGYRDGGETLCVMPLTGGPCEAIAVGRRTPDWEHTAGMQWSPDDRWIVAYPRDGSGWVLLNPEGGPPITQVWSELGLESWQRLAP
jgi:Tol biopolymer transport system component